MSPDPRFLHAPLRILNQERNTASVGSAPEFDFGLPKLMMTDGMVTHNDSTAGPEVVSCDDNPFALKNQQHATHVGVNLTSDLHIHIAATGEEDVSYARISVTVPKGETHTLIEQYTGGFGNNHITVNVADGAHVRIIRIVDGQHVNTWESTQGRDSNMHFVEVDLGGIVRNTLTSTLAGQGAHVTLLGLFLGEGKSDVDNYTRIDHAVPNCTSVQRYKGILDDESHGAFTGNILVRKDAQQTSSEQENRNLILSNKAHVDTTPQLEIHADDVKCAHGSTIGRLDDESIFFLRQRGLSEAAARTMLTKAFAAEVLELPDGPVSTWLHEQLDSWFERRVQA